MKEFHIPLHPSTAQLQTLVALHGVKFVRKVDSRLMRFISRLPLIPKSFMDVFWTTIGRTVYMPAFASDPYLYPTTVSHELVHVSQHCRFPVLFELTYLLFPVPVLFAYGRWYWEREAYMQNLAEWPTPSNVESIVNNLWSCYAWTWPRWLMRRWFNKQMRKL